MLLFVHVIDKTWNIAVMCNYIMHVYFHYVYANQILENMFSLRRKNLLEDIELCKVVFPVFCLLLPIGII